MNELMRAYFAELHRLATSAEVTDASGGRVELGQAIGMAGDLARTIHARDGKVMVIGNGGSAAIASHVATDYSKNGGIRTMAFNDGSMLTCLGNDLGYENVFAKQIALFAARGDLLIAISSSGASQNILNGVTAARDAGCAVITLSGFDPHNPLRGRGELNFYIAAKQYGFVEILHLTLCHAILDILTGWRPAAGDPVAERMLSNVAEKSALIV